MQQLRDQIDESANYVRSQWHEVPRVGIVLGSGLGEVGDAIELGRTIEYADVPNFLKSTAVGHRGRLVCGRLSGVPVVAMQGRFHSYEGYSAEQIIFPIRVMKALGIELLIVSNAAGGLNPTFAVGDVMVIDDHVNLLNRNPLIGVNDEGLGPRFPDMSAPYDRQLGARALAIAREHDFACHKGTYISVLGPNYETRAEIRMLRHWGDAVGMSTVPEAIVAAHAGLKLFGISTITNMCSPDVAHVASGDEVVKTANAASFKVSSIARGICPNWQLARVRDGRCSSQQLRYRSHFSHISRTYWPSGRDGQFDCPALKTPDATFLVGSSAWPISVSQRLVSRSSRVCIPFGK